MNIQKLFWQKKEERQMKTWWLKVWTGVDRGLDRYSSIGVLLSLVGLSIFVLITLSLAATYIALDCKSSPPYLFGKVTEVIISVFFADATTAESPNYARVVSLLLNIMVFLITISFVLLPALAWVKHKSELKKQKSIKAYRIYQDGCEDLRIMRKIYDGADKIIVFSGDFSWVGIDQAMESSVTKLIEQGKMELVSYKDAAAIQCAVSPDLFKKLQPCLRFSTLDDVKCSYVRRRGNSYFLYRHESSYTGETTTHVYVLTDTMESRYLLEVLGKLCTLPKCLS